MYTDMQAGMKIPGHVKKKLFLLMTVLSQTFFTLVSGYFMTFSFFTTRHIQVFFCETIFLNVFIPDVSGILPELFDPFIHFAEITGIIRHAFYNAVPFEGICFVAFSGIGIGQHGHGLKIIRLGVHHFC